MTSAGNAAQQLGQLAWKTLQGAREACGEHDELTREVSKLHKVLLRVRRELEDPDSPLIGADDDRRQELDELGAGCERILKIIDSIVSKYNALPEDTRREKKLWQKVQFGNGEMQDLTDIRTKLSNHTSAILISLNLCSLGCQGRVEKRLENIGELKGVRGKIHWITANMSAKNEETAWEAYLDDDREFWRELRRGLVKEGYHVSVLHKHRHLIKQYIEELGNRGVFDEISDIEEQLSTSFQEKNYSEAVKSSENLSDDAASTKNRGQGSEDHLDGDASRTNADYFIYSSSAGAESPRTSHGKNKRLPHTPTSSISALDFQYIDPETLTTPNRSTQTIFLPQGESEAEPPLTPPESPRTPKTSKYLRFDKRIHVGSINPKARKARTPEEQAAHDKRKEKRKSRTPDQQKAHVKRKEERKLGKRSVVLETDSPLRREASAVEYSEADEDDREEFTGRILNYSEEI